MTEIDRYGMGAVMDQALFHLDPYRNRSKPCNLQHATCSLDYWLDPTLRQVGRSVH
jgi:hypothetical protein